VRSSVLAVLALSGCAHVATLRPAAQGALEVEAALGGPVLKQGDSRIPLTLSSVGVRYGIQDRADVQLHYHPTASLLGVLGLDVGSTLLAVKGEKAIPDVAATIRLFGFHDFKTAIFRPYLQVGAVASWRLFNRFAPYVGVDWLGDGPYFAVAAGVQGIFGRFTLQLEGKWFSVARELRSIVGEWLSANDVGSFGVQLGVSFRFGAGAKQ
jgi:hypothetical protein